MSGNSDVRYVELHGDRVAYREAGSGEVLLLIHGMAGCSETWEPVFSLLSENYRVVAPDLLGHGLSAKPRTDYSLGAYAAGLRDLLDELGISKVTVVGHSLGGGVAMQFIYQHPEYCQRLILISSGGLGPDVGLILRLLSAPGAEFALPFIAPRPVLDIGNSLRRRAGAMGVKSPRGAEIWRAYSSFADGPTRHAFLRTLRSVVDYRGQTVSALNRLHVRPEVPTLLIWGANDHIIPVEHGYEAQAARAGSRLEILADVGHFPQVESPAEVAELICRFVSDHGNATLTAPLDSRDEQHPAARLKALMAQRALIDRAIGVLGSHFGLSSQDSLARLEFISQTENISLDEAAERLITDTVRSSTRC